jgi:hypothetical protein
MPKGWGNTTLAYSYYLGIGSRIDLCYRFDECKHSKNFSCLEGYKIPADLQSLLVGANTIRASVLKSSLLDIVACKPGRKAQT